MKNRCQHSVYVEKDDWTVIKEMAWQRRTSVSAMMIELFRKEANRKPRIKGSTPDRSTSQKGPTGAGKDAG